jgi:hypothetical protein
MSQGYTCCGRHSCICASHSPQHYSDPHPSTSGEIDREKLAGIVFQDKRARRQLNEATHIPIMVEILRLLFLAWLYCKLRVVGMFRGHTGYICGYLGSSNCLL